MQIVAIRTRIQILKENNQIIIRQSNILNPSIANLILTTLIKHRDSNTRVKAHQVLNKLILYLDPIIKTPVPVALM